ncbi:MAG: hypothetical protein NVS2B12_42080 [Ktedonobacteraceae bacterium]
MGRCLINELDEERYQQIRAERPNTHQLKVARMFLLLENGQCA